jgi:hypothetical protein
MTIHKLLNNTHYTNNGWFGVRYGFLTDEEKFMVVSHGQPCDTEKYHTVGLHAWQKFCRNVRIKLFSRVWNRFQWCSTDHQIIYGFSMIFCHSFVSDVILRRFFTKPRLILACDKIIFRHNIMDGWVVQYIQLCIASSNIAFLCPTIHIRFLSIHYLYNHLPYKINLWNRSF